MCHYFAGQDQVRNIFQSVQVGLYLCHYFAGQDQVRNIFQSVQVGLCHYFAGQDQVRNIFQSVQVGLCVITLLDKTKLEIYFNLSWE